MSQPSSSDLPEQLVKAVKGAGNSVFAIGVFNLIATTLLYLFSGSDNLSYLVLVLVGNAVLSIILINFGNNIKGDDLEDLEWSKKKVTDTITFVWVAIILFLFLGAFPGVFTILALFDLYKAKKQINNNI